LQPGIGTRPQQPEVHDKPLLRTSRIKTSQGVAFSVETTKVRPDQIRSEGLGAEESRQSGFTLEIAADQQETDRSQNQEIEESEVLQNSRHSASSWQQHIRA
jgi:hypothetical protein